MKDLYINLAGSRIDLRRVDFSVSTEIYHGLTGGQSVFEVKEQVWRAANFSLPEGTQAVFVSGYGGAVPLKHDGSVAIMGEMAQFRTDLAGQQKAYRTLLVSTGDNSLFYGREYKDFPAHYYQGTHPTGEIWGKIHPARRLATQAFAGVSGFFGSA